MLPIAIRNLAAPLLFSWSLISACSSICPATELSLQLEQANHLDIAPIENGWSLRTTGGDPYVFLKFRGVLDPANSILEIEYICPAGVKDPSLFAGPPLSAAGEIILPAMGIAEGWIRYTADLAPYFGGKLTDQTKFLRLDFGDKTDITLQIRKVHLRPPTELERERQAQAAERWGAKQAAAARISDYIQQNTTSPLEHVAASSATIKISQPPIPGVALDEVQLLEFPIHHAIGDMAGGVPIEAEASQDAQLGWTWTLPRQVDGRDRLNSGFALARRNPPDLLLTKRTFVNEFSGFSRAASIAPPKSQKGLAGFTPGGPRADIADLGLHAVTVNLMLTPFIKSAPGEGRIPIPSEGEKLFFDTRQFVGYDKMMRQAKENGTVVSAILLIPYNGDPSASPLYHPDADGGLYTMPDLTTPRGAAVYQFVIDQFASRYSDPDSDRGAIANWIIHNEVDFHSVWTNLGKQPREIVSEIYYRSLRLTYNIARQYQPSARVFASLTHHWTVPDDGGGRNLAPRELIEMLQKLSQQESDFDWGVAYHPYAQSLFAKTAWNDTDISDRFDTPLITFQNLDVLIRFLAQPQMLNSHNQPRPVLLSEQGFHTGDYDEETLAYQAASLLYAMDRVRQHPSIESFHYHRWIDHPEEGGLMLGLRTLPEPGFPYGRKKTAWEVLRDIDTDKEAMWRGKLPLPKQSVGTR